ncbi:MAG: GTP 3',8-cyclase MoaA [Myxococcales bacterium]|nr:GTP 3',8-cyclase MoaA [Myxococcales bacterium]
MGAAARLKVIAPLADAFARRVSYLRVSITDRCNYRCTYCMPEEGVALVPRPEVLTLEEVARIVGLLARVGVRRVRLTGGEPTVRHGLIDLIERLHALDLDDLALSTNGHTLAEIAPLLRRAGLTRLNVSVDSLDPEKFKQITRRGDFARVQAGVEAARDAGFRATKINAVALAGWNDDELPAIAAWAWERDAIPRFIEWMPMGGGSLFAPGGFLPAAQIRARLAAVFGPLLPDDGAGLPGVGPARYLRLASDETRRVGVISAVTEPFCDTCNRVRLSSTGQLHTCLARDETIDLRAPLRGGLSDEEILACVREGVAGKAEGHAFQPTGCGGPKKHMVSIGG